MSRGDSVDVVGCITETRGGGMYKITLDNDVVITAKLSGRMKRNHINVIPGDYVTVSMSPYDLTHGLITIRHTSNE